MICCYGESAQSVCALKGNMRIQTRGDQVGNSEEDKEPDRARLKGKVTRGCSGETLK